MLSLASAGPLHFSTFSHKWYIFFRKNVTEHKMSVFIFSTNFFERFLILRKFSEIGAKL